MPVHLETRGGRHCVVEPSGKVVPSGCYDNREDALARLRAINANAKGVAMGDNTGTETATTTDKSTSVTVPATLVQPTDNDGVMGGVETKEGAEEQEEKFMGFIDIGPTSFEELDEVREAAKEDMSIKTVVADFMAIVGNIMTFPSEQGKAADLRDLVKELEERLPPPEPLEEDAPEDGATAEKESDTTEMKSDGLFTIWKDAVTGEYRWIGIYSNKFRDSDSPSEILAEEAHLRFIERVEGGELAYPDLYVWHIPVPVGKANLLAYDDAGFSIAAGTVKEHFAIALQSTAEDLAMSHGMPAHLIRRDGSDQTVITDYVSTEISVLPRWAAANKMTDFYVLNEEEVKMAIIPEDKRQQVAGLLGDDLTAELEAGLEARSNKAVAEGIEFKEEGEQLAEETAASEAGATEMKTEGVEDGEGAANEQVAEGAEVVEESTDETEESVEEESVADAAEEDTANEEPMLQKQEVAEALVFVVEAMNAQTEQLAKSIQDLHARVDALAPGAEDGNQEKSTEEQLAELAAGTPAASLQAILAERFTRVDSVIGNPATLVKETDQLASEGPEEAPEEGETEGQSGLFFRDWN